jgi:hypothetical protein
MILEAIKFNQLVQLQVEFKIHCAGRSEKRAATALIPSTFVFLNRNVY